MNGYSKNDERYLLNLLESQKQTIERILELTEEQEKMLEADDIDGFNLSLDRRQSAIEKYDGLHQESLTLMQSYKSLSNDSSEGIPQAVNREIRAIGGIMKKCKDQDEKNALAAHAKADDYSSRIGSLDLKRKSLGAYIQNVSNNAELFDKKM